MTTTSSKLPWARIAAESVAIIASILLAFAIDAWWQQRGEHHRSLSQLSTIRTEFIEVGRRLEREERQLVGLREAVADFLLHIGPQAPLASIEDLVTLMDLSFRASRIELPTGSLQALLASGELSAVENDELKVSLVTWPAGVARLRSWSGMLEDNREEIIRYLHDKIPTLSIAHKTGEMNAYPPSSFEVEPQILQRDMKIEGLFGNRGMLIEDTLDVVYRLKSQAENVGALIDAELGE